MKSINKINQGSKPSFKIQKSKTFSGFFDVNFYDPLIKGSIQGLKIEKISKAELEHLESYLDTHTKRDISFGEFLENIGFKKQEHFVLALIENAYEVEASLLELVPEWSETIRQNYKKVFAESNKNGVEISSDVFALERISDDIYGTTTMEGEIVDKEYVEKIIKNKNIVGGNLSELEATNIRNGFTWAYKQSLDKNFNFSSEIVQKAHSVTTQGLDLLVVDGLKYNSGKFRDFGVDMGIFQSVNGKSEYYPPIQPDEAMKKLEAYMSKGDFNIIKLAHMHLFLYSLHPFANGNKRSTRIVESLAIQSHYDSGHYFKGMGYWYKKNMPTYLKKVKGVLSGKISLREWVIYYVSSFIAMTEYTYIELTQLKSDVRGRINPTRLRYYDDIDNLFNRFYLKNKDDFFSAKELNKYLISYDKIYSDEKQIYKRLSKHLKDHLIIKTEEKDGKYTLYRVNLERK